MKILETERLVLRKATVEDAAFILRLVNDPSWIRYIGDKNITSLEDAKKYIQLGPMAMYAKHGFGLFITELKNDHTPVGLCGLIKREELDDIDLGFAFLPEYRGKGYAIESSSAVIIYGKTAFGITRIVAITLSENTSSVNLLTRLGFRYEHKIHQEDKEKTLQLYALRL